MDLKAAEAFFLNYVELDYQAQFHAFGDEPSDGWMPHLVARRELFSSKIRTRGYLDKGGAEKREKLVRRKLFAVAVFESKARGTVAAGYVGGNGGMPAGSLDHIFFVAESEGKHVIVQDQSVDVDGDVAHIRSSSGEELGDLGKPIASKIFEKPTSDAEAKLLP